MAQFAHYYIKYKHDFAPYEWEKRQQHLGALFEKDESIEFSMGEGEGRQLYAKYGLTDDEIVFIDSMIKPI
jgi:hypothetical protein